MGKISLGFLIVVGSLIGVLKTYALTEQQLTDALNKHASTPGLGIKTRTDNFIQEIGGFSGSKSVAMQLVQEWQKTPNSQSTLFQQVLAETSRSVGGGLPAGPSSSLPRPMAAERESPRSIDIEEFEAPSSFSSGRDAAQFIESYQDTDVSRLVRQVNSSASASERKKAGKALLQIRNAIQALERDVRTGSGTKGRIARLKSAYEGFNWGELERRETAHASLATSRSDYQGDEPTRTPALREDAPRSSRNWRDNVGATALRKAALGDTLQIIRDVESNGLVYVSPSRRPHAVVTRTPVIVIRDSLDCQYALRQIASPTLFEFCASDTLDCALRSLTSGSRHVAILDMANRNFPGGGPRDGAPAQEEQICYRSTLLPILERFSDGKQGFIPELGALYLPTVTVFKKSEQENFGLLQDPFSVSVIASAAYRSPTHSRSDAPQDRAAYLENTKEKIRSQLAVALMYDHREIILGAFGCGAFKNEPQDIARSYEEVFQEPRFNGQFDVVRFAVFGGGDNQVAFEDMVRKLNGQQARSGRPQGGFVSSHRSDEDN